MLRTWQSLAFVWVAVFVLGAASPAESQTADLSLSAVASANPVTFGSTITYEITVTNNGPDIATPHISAGLSPGQIMLTVNPNSGTCLVIGSFECDLGAIAMGASQSITILARANTVGSISSFALVSSAAADPDNTNDQVVQSATVKGPASVLFALTKEPASGFFDPNTVTDSATAIEVLDLATMQAFEVIPLGKYDATSLSMSPNGRMMYVIDRKAGQVLIIDRSYGPQGSLSIPGAQDAALSPDGATLYVTGAQSVHAVDTATMTITRTASVAPDMPLGISVSPDGAMVAVAVSDTSSIGSSTGALRLFDAPVLTPRWRTVPVGTGCAPGVSPAPTDTAFINFNEVLAWDLACDALYFFGLNGNQIFTVDAGSDSVALTNFNNVLRFGATWPAYALTDTALHAVFSPIVPPSFVYQFSPDSPAVAAIAPPQLLPDESLFVAVHHASGPDSLLWLASPTNPVGDLYDFSYTLTGTPYVVRDMAIVPMSVEPTAAGSGVVVEAVNVTGAPVRVTFDSVTQDGSTTVTATQYGPAPPTGFQLGTPAVYWDVSTTAGITGSIEVCFNYGVVTLPGPPQLFHYEETTPGVFDWVDVTTSVDPVNDIICGSVTTLSPFAVFSRSASIPSLRSDVSSLPLNRGETTSLMSKLGAAESALARGSRAAAARQLEAFIDEVLALKQSHRLAAVQADPLIVEARLVIASM